MSRHRAWTFTINNDTADDLDRLLDLSFRYLIIGFEKGDKKQTPHIQGYVYFAEACTMKSLSKKLPRARLEEAKGSPEQNRTYCSKSSEFYEFGEMPHQGFARWELIEDVMADPRSNPHLFQQYNKMYKQLTYCKKKDHERKLMIVSSDEAITVAKSLDTYKVTFETDKDLYDDDDVMIMPTYCDSWVLEWLAGFPPRAKRGYEMIIVDPQIVIITYRDVRELNYLRKKYLQYIDTDGLPTIQIPEISETSDYEIYSTST